MRIGLFFGSFNPIHIGHLAIANYMTEFTDLEQVWFVVSPHNPLKDKKGLIDSKKRLMNVKEAVGRNSKIKVSSIEFDLPQPSYTINTLNCLQEKYPDNKFVIIMGSDNLNLFHKWKDYKKILNGYEIYVYPRSSALKVSALKIIKSYPNIRMIDAPRIDISSTFIREQIRRGKDVRYFVPAKR